MTTDTFTQRATELVAQMTLDEKISQMMHDAPAIPRLNIPAYNWWNECLHGVGRAGIATVFPQAIGLAATWNTDLLHQVATAIGDEARAKHHEAQRQGDTGIYKGLNFWAPNINIFRDPRWGRGQETYGEDPFLTAQLGVAFVTGLQGDDPVYLKVVATPKHFAVHSGPEQTRAQFDVHPSLRDVWETYLPAFEACVRQGKAASVMGAYNRLYGAPCCANDWLLNDILRDKWGFEGFVFADCGAILNIYKFHQVVQTAAEASALAVNNGCDMDCGTTYQALSEAVASGLIEEATLDRALVRAFVGRYRLGMFDPSEQVPYTKIPISVNNCPAHQALALRAAHESIILLKNDNHFLPLAPDVRRIAIIGPNAHDPQVLLGNYNGTPAHSVTPLDGIRAKVSADTQVLYARGCGVYDLDENGMNEAVDLAKHSDVVIFVGGLCQAVEGEEGQQEGLPTGLISLGDRTRLELTGIQEALLKRIHATGTPIVLVLLNGSAVAINWADEHLPAIVEAWYPGEAGGTAIADVLFGAYNPAGRLPVTFYRSTEDLPPFEDYTMQGRTYRYFTGEPLYPFGHGLSYTQFMYTDMTSQLTADGCDVTVTVSNIGLRAGDEVVQLYANANRDGYPQVQLVGFTRIHLLPNQAKRVTIPIHISQLMRVTDDGEHQLEKGTFTLYIGGGQPRWSMSLQDEIQIYS